MRVRALATVALALFAGCGGGGETLPEIQAKGVLLELLTSDVEREVVSEPTEGAVRMLTLSPNPARPDAGGVMRALTLPPGSEVRLQVPRGPSAELAFSFGVQFIDPRSPSSSSASETPERAVFELEVGGQALTFTIDVPSEGAPGDARWSAGTTPLSQGGGEIVLRTRYEGGAESSPRPLLAVRKLEVVAPLGVRRTRATAERPNVILILVDTLRADRLGCYGYSRGTSPQVDSLAERGLVFERAWSSASWTWPSTASVLTALSPPEHGVLSHEACYLAEQLDTLAEPLQRAGFTTAAFSTNPLVSEGQNYDQGFERYWERFWARSTVVMPEVERFLDELGEYRFFLYLHLTDPHRPYQPEADLVQRFAADVPEGYTHHGFVDLARAVNDCEVVPDEPLNAWMHHASDLYDGEVASTDRQIGKLLAKLEALGLTDRTVIAFTSDHGEEFLEHGRFAHGQQLYEETIHVPLVLAGPGVPRGRRVSESVENRFLAPTLLELAGVEAPGNLRAKALLAEPVPVSTELFFNTEIGVTEKPGERSVHAFRSATEHFVWAPPMGEEHPELVRYHELATDPNTQRDVAAEHAERVTDLKHRIVRWWKDGERRRPEVFGAAEGADELLQALGYMGKDE